MSVGPLPQNQTHRIYETNGNGVFSLTTAGGSFSTFIAQATTPYNLNNARDLQWSGGDLYVSARNSNAVYRFNSSGTYVSTLPTGLTGASGLGIDGATLLVNTNAAAAAALKKIDAFATAPLVGTITPTGKINGLEIGVIEGQEHYLTFNQGTGTAGDINRLNPDGSSTVMVTFNTPVVKRVNDFVVDGDVDSDADGLPDGGEMAKFGTLAQGPSDDFDMDGLTNLQEYNLGTNPALADTDGDGISDDLEVLTYHTNPNADADKGGDTLSDSPEVLIYKTDPSLKDTDGDGFDDNVEGIAGSDPNDPKSTPSNIPGYGGTLVHRYKLDETSGTVALDSIGTENGTIGADVVLGQPGRDGTAVRIPSPVTAASKILLPKAVVPVAAAPFTMTAWVRLSAALVDGGQSHILSADDGSGGRWNLGIVDADTTAGVNAEWFCSTTAD